MIPERLTPGTPEWVQFHHEHEQRYEFFAARYAGLDVLDVACGVGYGSSIIAGARAKTVTGIDIDADAVEYAKKHYARPGITFSTGSAECLTGLGQRFDLVVSFETIEHLKTPGLFLAEVRGALRPGGVFICSTPNRDFSGKDRKTSNPYHCSEMTFDEFASAFEKNFVIEEQYHQSPTEAYRRHLELVGQLGRLAKAVRFSRFLRLENRIRKLLGKDQWQSGPLPDALTRVVPGDYVIEPVVRPSDAHLTFILAGHAKP